MLVVSKDPALPPFRPIDMGGNATISLRPATLIDLECVQAEVRRAAALAREGNEVIARYGPSFSASADLLAEDEAGKGLGEVMLITELTLRCAEGPWRGIQYDDGSDYPMTRENVARLVLDVGVATAFRTVLFQGVHKVVSEGNDWPPSSSGDAGAASTTALAAGSKGSRARKAGPESTGSGAPSS